MDDKAYLIWEVEEEEVIDCNGNHTGLYVDFATIDVVFVPKSERGHGKGRKMIEDALLDIRSKHDEIEVRLSALPFDDGMETDKLVKFYESMGFEVYGSSYCAVLMKMNAIKTTE